MNSKNTYVQKEVLDNGMTVLVRPVKTIPKVSVQLWYGVGSVHEKDSERGIAHLIEHMIFKGTDKLSESDINMVTHKLSGNCNAFTSYDYTGYLFNFPTHHWQEALPIMADCMRNCTFKEDMLSSEMKAVVQELKMYRDRYMSSLFDAMIGTIFSDHPYHHPIIGYKQDLWTVNGDDLKAFYKKHYVPNNATLVVVGDVDPKQVFALAKENFGALKKDETYEQKQFYFGKDIASKAVTIYRDVQQPLVLTAFVVPGIRDKQDHLLNFLAHVLGRGKSSRLYKKIVEQEQLATSLSAGSEELFDHGIFYVAFEPKTAEDIPAIEKIIHEEIAALDADGIEEKEFTRAVKQTQMELYELLEDLEHQAYEIGKYFVATKDKDYIFTHFDEPIEVLKKQTHALVGEYLRPTVMHKGMILPLPESEKEQWAKLQERSDQEDKKILSERERTTPVEPVSYAKNIEVKEPTPFEFPRADVAHIPNGLKVLSYTTKNTPKIDLVLSLKAKHFYDPEGKDGTYRFVSKMLPEGTKSYTAAQLADEVESRGMSLASHAGGVVMSMLKEDLPFALEIVNELVHNATFPKDQLEKVRTQIVAQIKQFWDDPRSFVNQLVREQLYKTHPYSKSTIGTQESITAITRDDLVNFYDKYISPDGARLSLVGDLNGYDVPALVQEKLGNWAGPKVPDAVFPLIPTPQTAEVNYPINRDQVFLCLAALSIDRKHEDYDKLLLFDQIFGGGALGSMSSRLFQLREESGLFYTISGSLVSGADEQPGMISVRTIVSLDRLEEAEKAIRQTIDTAADTITEQEFSEAKNAIINSQVDYFASNYGIANVLLFLDRYDFSPDFFNDRAMLLASITIDDVKSAVKKVMAGKTLLTFRVGRIEGKEKKVTQIT